MTLCRSFCLSRANSVISSTGLLALIVLACCTQNAFAGGGPENVVVVVNANSDSSKYIAHHYQQLRDIPAQNMVYLDNVPAKSGMRLTEFREKILRPLFRELSKRKLLEHVDYIVYSSDFPTRFNFGVERRGAKIPKTQLRIYNPEASISSLTYFSSSVLEGKLDFMGLTANQYMRVSARSILQAPFEGDEQLAYRKGVKKFSENDHDGALAVFDKLAKKFPTQVAVHYWLAKTHAMLGDSAKAIDSLKMAIRTGWCFRDYTRNDKAFGNLADDSTFKDVVQTIQDQEFKFAPTRGFRSQYSWSKNGMVNAVGPSDQGQQYMLSTVLGITGAHGQTESEICENLSLSVAADGTRPKGTFYFTKTKDVRCKTRAPRFDYACDELRGLGHKAEIVSTVVPKFNKKVLGLTMGAGIFDWSKGKSEIIPGAICENLTSFGGRFAEHGQTRLTELLKGGAAGSSGTVIEPYAIQPKFPDPRIHVHYAKGCSLAEAFYQSVHGPFQLLIAGDALCQPFAVFPEFDILGVEAGSEVSGNVSMKVDYSKSEVPVSSVDFYVDGVRIKRMKAVKRINFPSEKLSDGFHEIRIVAVSGNAIETTGRVVVPVVVNNHGHEVVLSSAKPSVNVKGELQFSASANCGKKISLWHNGRKISSKANGGQKVSFKVSARDIGRGESKVYAVVEHEGGMVRSLPVEIDISG